MPTLTIIIAGHSMNVENDCEDQGYGLIADGCQKFSCQTWDIGATKPTKPALVIEERSGQKYWVCPKCGGGYGLAEVSK